MKAEEVRIVWLFVFFDLPVTTKTGRRLATDVTPWNSSRNS